jgi:uncharacterized protein (TIGR02147 family)
MSARALSSKARLGPPNYVSLILDGKRRLSVSGALSLAGFMGLNADETQDLVALVQYCEAKDEREKAYFARQLAELRRSKPKDARRLLRQDLAADWGLPIILLLSIDQTRDSASRRISDVLKIKKVDAEKHLDLLEREGLLTRGEVYAVSSDYFAQRDPKAKKKSVALFLQQHVRLLANSLAKKYSADSKHIVHALGGKAVRKEELFALLEKTSEQSAALVADDAVEEVFVMHLHCQPLSDYL